MFPKICTSRTKIIIQIEFCWAKFCHEHDLGFWEGLIRPSLSKKRPRNLFSRHKGCRLLVIEPVHCGSNSILKLRFFGHPVLEVIDSKGGVYPLPTLG